MPIVCGTEESSGDGPTSMLRPKQMAAATGITNVAPTRSANGGAATYATELTRVTQRRRLPIAPGVWSYGAAAHGERRGGGEREAGDREEPSH